MGAFKWIFGFLGWVTWGPIGAILGYVSGAAIERSIENVKQISGAGTSDSGQYSSQRGSYSGTRGYSASEQRNSFLVSLLVLSSAVIKADGKTLQSEIDVVKDFIRRNFGESAVSESVRMLQRILSQEVNIYSVGGQIAANMNYSQRLQLFHYLTQIARADGDFSKAEKSVLEAIASAIGLTSSDAASV
ncbi:MAG: TerB family tellurite resistance protein, partial [Bacteroidales bacterium]|nr:TerB family tellurite resistance protein [Bacteroidales bacterium]